MYYPFFSRPNGPLIVLGTVKIVFSYILSMTPLLHVTLYCPIISSQKSDKCAIITNMLYTLHDRGSDIVKDVTYVK